MLEPQPGQRGFLKVISIIVQCLPLKVHFPGRDIGEKPIPKAYQFEDAMITAGWSVEVLTLNASEC